MSSYIQNMLGSNARSTTAFCIVSFGFSMPVSNKACRSVPARFQIFIYTEIRASFALNSAHMTSAFVGKSKIPF